jgi:hypothetical protein
LLTAIFCGLSFVCLIQTAPLPDYAIIESAAVCTKFTMMDKLPKTGSELEKMVLAELREVPQCTGALHVTVVPYNDYRVPATCPTGREDDGYR